MGRIPVFSDYVAPQTAMGSSAIQVARAQGDQNAEAFGEVQRNAGQIDNTLSEFQLRQAQADNATAVNGAVIQYKKDLTDQQAAMQQERMANPTDFHKDFDQLAQQNTQSYLDSMPSDVAKTALQTSMAGVRGQMYDENLHWENTRKVDMYAGSVEKTAQNLGDIAYQRGLKGLPVDDLLRDGDANAIAGSTFIAPEKVQSVADKTKQTIYKGQLTGMITANPTHALQIINGQADTYNAFDQAASFVQKQEGGFVSNDGGKGPTNFGINSEANPDVDVTKLTPDSAKAIIKARYWDAIGADSMPPALASVALDSAVNQGVGATKEMLAQANGNVDTLIQLREDRYRQTATNPDKAPYLNGWLARLDSLKQFASDQATSPTVGSKPDPSIATLPFAEVAELRSKANTFLKQDIELRDKDPATYAQVHGLTPNAPLSFSDPTALKVQLASRDEAAQTLTTKYGAPYKPLTDQEAKGFTALTSTMPTDQKLGLLSMFRDSSATTQGYIAALQQIRPDSPATAMAGMYLGIDRTLPGATHWFSPNDPAVTPSYVAKNILDGEDLLNPPKAQSGTDGKKASFPIPPDGNDLSVKGLRPAFDNYVGDSFRNMPQGENDAYQAYRSFYAAEAAKQGNYSGILNTDIAAKAVSSVIGNVGDKNGHSYVMPWGMDETTFNNRAQAQFDSIKKVFNFDRVDYGDVSLENTGEPGKYRMVVGAGYLSDAGGMPLTLKLGQ